MTVISGISIILPTLNERDNLKLLIPSIVEMLDDLSIENYEVLVVDDNSTDGTKDLLETLNQKNGKIKIFICRWIYECKIHEKTYKNTEFEH